MTARTHQFRGCDGRSARGKRVVGSVMVAFGGTTAKRSLSVTVG